MSGRADEEDVKQLIFLIRNIQSLAMPDFAALFDANFPAAMTGLTIESAVLYPIISTMIKRCIN